MSDSLDFWLTTSSPGVATITIIAQYTFSQTLICTTMTSTSTRQPLYLRCEMKKAEHRAALTPTTAKQLLDAGFDVTVERDPQRIFDDEEYER